MNSSFSPGQDLWRSLDERGRTPEFLERLHREFPEGASEWSDAVSRRRFLKLMGASLALAGLYGCSREPEQKIVPYVNPPEQIVPGKRLFYATAMPMGGYGLGVLVESHEGRPTKVEGNPDHPASLGATNAFMQSSILMLYDPDRSNVILERGNVSSWGALLAQLGAALERHGAGRGAGIRLLTETVTSPTLAEQLRQFLGMYPGSKWHQYDPVGRDNVLKGTRLAFGPPLNPIWRFDQADVVLALDSDFLSAEPGSVRYARQFIDRRRVRVGQASMNRLYAIEPTATITGAMADHRLPVKSARVENLARAVARALGVDAPPPAGELPAAEARWAQAVAADLAQHRGAALVLAGAWQPPTVHALAYAMNQALGCIGKTVVFTDPVEVDSVGRRDSLRQLVSDMEGGAVDLLAILGGNPAYTAPADVDFAGSLLRMSRASGAGGAARAMTIHLGLYNDETARLCQWHLPQSHYLESWSDVRAFDGATTIIQPLIAPLYRSRTDHELLAALMGNTDRSDHDLVRAYWQKQHGDSDFERFWQTSLEKGVVEETASPLKPMENMRVAVSGIGDTGAAQPAVSSAGGGIEIVFRPDPCVWDGSFANIGWQQELPKPLTHLVWDNAALLSPATASRMGLSNSDEVELKLHGRSVRAPVWMVPGQADDVLTVHLGYGRTHAGNNGTGAGFNAYLLRTVEASWFDAGVGVRRTGERYPLVATQTHQTINSRAIEDTPSAEVLRKASTPREAEEPAPFNRKLVRVGTLGLFQEQPDFAARMEGEKKPLLSLFPGYAYTGYKWGMSIDLNSCIGCNACVVACQAENNIPVVGKDQCAREREMHWIRIDTYCDGAESNPRMYHQPVPCMHCENAPCEVVCPVGATVHDSEGINNMVYNRCVGTRYCSNNCPYKVRRFNFFQYSDTSHPTIAMQKNPNVTVRSRGVMEKCTYCIQRISAARIEAEKQDRAILDGEIQTACQQACPTRAIVFGDLNDPRSQVKALHDSPLTYGILEELTTKPRTRYMARLINPNPALQQEGPA